MLLAACCLTLTGCARKETGSELLTETKDAVVPVDGKVDPVVEETPEGTAFHLYYGDENAENIVQKTVYVDKVTEDSVMEQLAQALKLDSNIRLKKISFGMHGGDKVVMLDFNQAFADYMKKLSQSGELNEDTMLSIMMEQKKPVQANIILSGERLRKYFPRSYSPIQMEEVIFKLLEAWQRKRQREQSR